MAKSTLRGFGEGGVLICMLGLFWVGGGINHMLGLFCFFLGLLITCSAYFVFFGGLLLKALTAPARTLFI